MSQASDPHSRDADGVALRVEGKIIARPLFDVMVSPEFRRSLSIVAQRSDVLKTILLQSIIWSAIGVPLASSASRLVQGLLGGLSTSDLGTLITAAIVISS